MLNSALEKQISGVQSKAFVVGVAGLAVTFCALFAGPSAEIHGPTAGAGGRFFQALLIAWILLLGLPLGGMATVMLRHLAGGAWSVFMQRVCEACGRTLWYFFAVGLFIFLLGANNIFPWLHYEYIAEHHVVEEKLHYLNLPFFYTRYIIFFAIWAGLIWFFGTSSKRLDETGNQMYAVRTARFAAVGLILYVATITFAATDWGMSLEPEWFSTIYPVIWLVSQCLLTLAFTIVVLSFLKDHEPIKSRITTKQFHQLGNFLLGFVILWSYVSFSQFLIIWSGNVPEEIGWYLNREGGGLTVVTAILMLFHFLVPMLILLFRKTKQRIAVLRNIALWIIAMRVVDIYWNIAPSFAWNKGVIDLLSLVFILSAIAGLGGIWLYLFLRELKKRPLLPVHDPLFEEMLPNTSQEEAPSHAA